MAMVLRPSCAYKNSITSIHFSIAKLLLAIASLQGSSSNAHAAVSGLNLVTSALSDPIYATHAPGDNSRLFVAERNGAIRIVDLATGQVNAQSFLQIPDSDAAGEGGLLGLAFHPDYQNNGKFYTYVTVDNGGISIDGQTSPFSSHVREYTVSVNPEVANATPKEIVSWVQPRNNHNAGWIGFSPVDNYLYITSGDGGKQGDPDNNAQTLDENNPGQTYDGEPLGKVLRLDVDSDAFPADANRNYASPASNPFVGNASANDEIWAYGLRNPWRASFDRQNGDFWIGDVGQGTREEINQQLASSTGGENYAWQRREGTFSHQGGALLPGDVEPVYDYGHGFGALQGNSVVGGVVYRGPDPSLQGTYFFADTVSSNLWSFDSSNPGATITNINSILAPGVVTPVAFGEDAVGNLYVVALGGSLFQIETDQLITGDFDANGLVNQLDLDHWQAGFGTVAGANVDDGDANADGQVDGADFLIWQKNLGTSSQAVSAFAVVPEPGTLSTAFVGLLAVLMRRKRARV